MWIEAAITTGGRGMKGKDVESISKGERENEVELEGAKEGVR